jgi:Raf kinase inhibitor-like YbhB/YbcL family protein
MTFRRSFSFAVLGLALMGAGCNGGQSNPMTSSNATSLLPSPTLQGQQRPSRPEPTGPMTITSSVFQDGQPIPEKYTCKGQDFSPPVTFANVPLKAVSIALIMKDADAPYTHWVLYNVAPDVSGVAEGDVPPGAAGQSTSGKLGYEGPCPPAGDAHHYTFTLSALDNVVNVQDGVPVDEVEKAMEGHVISTATLKGTYQVAAAASEKK